MPKYHFTGQGAERLLAIYDGGGNLLEFSYGVDIKSPNMVVKNAHGPLIFVDCASEFVIDKIHIGEGVMRSPHAENHRLLGRGPRVDLHELDFNYLRNRLEELRKWKNDSYRESVRDRYYKENDRYWARHRLRQLTIEGDRLEGVIDEHERLFEELSGNDSSFVSDNARSLECEAGNLDRVMTASTEDIASAIKSKKKSPKKVVDFPLAVNIGGLIYHKLKDLLTYINRHIDVESVNSYWPRVEQWGATGRYIFIGCIPGAKEHIERHTQRQIIGAGFYPDFIPRFFSSTSALMYFAIQQVKELGYYGGALLHQVEFSDPIGFNEVVALDNLPRNAKIRTGTRGGDERDVVNIVSGVEKTLTHNLVIVLAPYLNNEYGIHTIFHGNPSPNFSDVEFWSKHAFIE